MPHMVCHTESYKSGNGFWPGGGFFWPLDPRDAIVDCEREGNVRTFQRSRLGS